MKEIKSIKSSAARRFSHLIYNFISMLDHEMEKSSSDERGRNIAKLANYLEMEVDRFSHFDAGLSFKVIKNMKKKAKLKTR